MGGGLILVWVLAVGGLAKLGGMSAGSFALLAVSIVLAIAVGDVLFFESARFLGLARAMTVSMTYPLMGAVLAAVFLDEPISARLAVGSVITLSGLAIIVLTRPT